MSLSSLTPAQTYLRAVNDYRALLSLPALTAEERLLFTGAAEAVHPADWIKAPTPVPPISTIPIVGFISPTASTLSGAVKWEASASATDGVAKVEFYIDGVLKWSEGFAPYVFNGDGKTWDTTTVSKGTHDLKLLAYSTSGGTASVTHTVTVDNTVPTPPPTSGMVVAVNGGSWGTAAAADLKNCVPYVRVSRERSDTTLHNYLNAGLKVIALFYGPYSTSGVSGIGNPDSWANAQLSWYRANCTPDNTPLIEILNEPYGSWFWGGNATSQANADAYARLLKSTWTVFHNAYGAKAPKILAAYDTWGSKWWNSSAVMNVGQYVDGITIHPYGGSSGQYGGANGNRSLVTNSHNATGKPVYVTEVGWPTCGGTSDSQSWSESAQATNVYNFVNWSRGTGYVGAVSIYNDRDESGSRCYGIMHHDGGHKAAWDALRRAAAGL